MDAESRAERDCASSRSTGRPEDFVDQLPLGIGHAKSDDFIVLLFIGFSVSDVDKPVP